MLSHEYDIVVVGAGHAGCEAALIAAKLGVQVLLITGNLDSCGQMSCNPAIGGIGKGQLVKEIDALGGVMAKNIDATGIQFRVLNSSKGPAVQSSRAQADKELYKSRMKSILENAAGLTLIQDIVEEIRVSGEKLDAITTQMGRVIKCKVLVLTTGTFLKGLMHTGKNQRQGGRSADIVSNTLSDSLRSLGLELGRLKTGTPPRLHGKSINFDACEEQAGDSQPKKFSFSPSSKILQKQVSCFITYTNDFCHQIIKDNKDRSPLFSGEIKGVGPRYCPSIEDKVFRFAGKDRHQIFLEPEGLNTQEIYVNGLSTSLPLDVQEKIVHNIPGLENAQITRAGYAVEYDYVLPYQLNRNLSLHQHPYLFLAGQINGTSGYEEAAAQGLYAGINAALYVKEQDAFYLSRHESYIGVLVDDLITKGNCDEPYRMFTSRVEQRLFVREDNADLRLSPYAERLDLLDANQLQFFKEKSLAIHTMERQLDHARITPSPSILSQLEKLKTTSIKKPTTLAELLQRPEITYQDLYGFSDSIPLEGFLEEARSTLQNNIKYRGYIEKHEQVMASEKKLMDLVLPQDFLNQNISGLSNEVFEKLKKFQPKNLSEASQISGITPASISILAIHLRRTL